MASRVCHSPDCDAVIPPQQGSARPRKYCVACRPPRNRKNPRVIDLPKQGPSATAVPDLPDLGEPETPPLVAMYRQQLETAERVASPEGAHVLHLANLFASGQHTAAGAAALSKELRAAMEMAMRGAPKAADALDDLARRRQMKASGA